MWRQTGQGKCMSSYARQSTRFLVLLTILFLNQGISVYAMESASLHLSQLKAPAKATRDTRDVKAHRNKPAVNSLKEDHIHVGLGSKELAKVPAQPETTRNIQREALKLSLHKQTLLKQIDLAENIARSIDILQAKAECLQEHTPQEDKLSLSQELQQSEVDLQKESMSIEEQVLNVLERRVSEYEALVLKLADRSSRLFSLYYEAKDLITQLNDSNNNLIKRHLTERTRGPESGVETRNAGDRKTRPDARRLIRRSIKQ